MSQNLTVPEVADRLRCKPWTVRRLINDTNGLRASFIGGRWLVTEDDLTAYQESQANRAAPVRRRRRRAA